MTHVWHLALRGRPLCNRRTWRYLVGDFHEALGKPCALCHAVLLAEAKRLGRVQRGPFGSEETE